MRKYALPTVTDLTIEQIITERLEAEAALAKRLAEHKGTIRTYETPTLETK